MTVTNDQLSARSRWTWFIVETLLVCFLFLIVSEVRAVVGVMFFAPTTASEKTCSRMVEWIFFHGPLYQATIVAVALSIAATIAGIAPMLPETSRYTYLNRAPVVAGLGVLCYFGIVFWAFSQLFWPMWGMSSSQFVLPKPFVPPWLWFCLAVLYVAGLMIVIMRYRKRK